MEGEVEELRFREELALRVTGFGVRLVDREDGFLDFLLAVDLVGHMVRAAEENGKLASALGLDLESAGSLLLSDSQVEVEDLVRFLDPEVGRAFFLEGVEVL